jgi:protein-tyrosine phosphatase
MTAADGRERLMGFYRTATETYAPEYKAMFARLVKGDSPTIVHCTAGKDRTGVASALVLTALGVPRQTVEADYALTADLLQAGKARREASPGYRANMATYAKMPPEVMRAMEASDPAYIDTALDAATAKYGSLDAYLEQALGVGPKERAALRAKYLE